MRQHVVGLGDRCEDGFVEAVQGAEEAGAVAFEGELVLRGRRVRLVDGVEPEVLKFVARNRLSQLVLILLHEELQV